MDLEKRDINLDFIRGIAVFSVISVHFFLYIGYYNEMLNNWAMYFATLMRTMFLVGVPLFMMLTGYLKNKKTLSKKHYFGIKKTVIIYILATFCAVLYRKYVMEEAISVLGGFLILFSYQQYSWFIEMYFGLFLLIPFLNMIYHNLKSKKEKLFLIGVMFFLTAMPSLLNTYSFTVENWFLNPVLSFEYHKLIPAWWVSIYPLTFYFIGAYFCEYRNEIKISLGMNFLLFVVCLVLFTAYNIWRSAGVNFIYGVWNERSGFQSVICAALLFMLLMRLDMTKTPLWIKKLMYHTSQLAFGIYLSCWIFDQYAYPILTAQIPTVLERMPYYFVMVPFIFVCSWLLSFVLDKIYSLIDWIWGLLKSVFRKEKSEAIDKS